MCKTTQRLLILLILLSLCTSILAQKNIPLIKATSEKAIIKDGKNNSINWKLDPELKPDIYYVNVPLRKSKIILKSDRDEIRFKTKPGESYDVIVLLNKKDTCHIRISSVQPPTPIVMNFEGNLPKSIPFALIGSRIYFKGELNGKSVNIQFDLGAGTNFVNKAASNKLGLKFSKSTLVSNTDGISKERTSINNHLKVGGINWSGIPVTEVGNMEPYEDMIIGNALFRDKIIEIDYERNELIVHNKLPLKAKSYFKQPVYYYQNRPKFKAEFVHGGKKYSFWFLFDTGRDGTMLIGEDFTCLNKNWQELDPLMMIKGRKIIRLDAIIAGKKIKDIVTNAADPAAPQGRPSLFGNQILSHFNVILNNPMGAIYLKPNSRTGKPYSDYESYLKEVSQMKKDRKRQGKR